MFRTGEDFFYWLYCTWPWKVSRLSSSSLPKHHEEIYLFIYLKLFLIFFFFNLQLSFAKLRRDFKKVNRVHSPITHIPFCSSYYLRYVIYWATNSQIWVVVNAVLSYSAEQKFPVYIYFIPINTSLNVAWTSQNSLFYLEIFSRKSQSGLNVY